MREPIPEELLDLIATKFRMLSDTTRLAILRTLMEGESSVGAIVAQTGRTQANISKHLKMLHDGGLISRRKEGLQVFYRLDDAVVAELCHLVCDHILKDLEAQWKRQKKLLSGKRRR
jgi:ArsR family transcriptional regulator